MNIEKLVKEIIPPGDYQHRNGFNNIPLIDKLNDDEKGQLEAALIHKLQFESAEQPDTLVVETLAVLKSEKSVQILKQLLEKCTSSMTKLVIAASIYEINGENGMVDIAINNLKKIDDKSDAYYVYKLTSAFYYLIKFNDPRVISIIEEYANHNEYLVAYNAKRVLNK